jgi:anti-sigma factor RsiW
MVGIAETLQLSFAGEQRRAEMRNKLVATVAVAAVIGFGGFAAAQVPPGTTSDKIQQKSGVQPVSEDQHSQIKTAIARGTSPRVDRRLLNFDVAIGSRVPQSLHVVTLPDELVKIVPQYRGFNYFLISYRTKDPGGADYFFVKDELVIVDPKTLEIVAIVPV